MARIAFVGGSNPIKLGIAHLSSYLKSNGHYVEYVGSSIGSRSFGRLLGFSLDDYLDGNVFDLFAFSVNSHDYTWSVSAARRLKRAFPETPIIFGGPLCTLIPDAVLKNPAVDYVCVGDGEKPLAEMAGAIDGGELETSAKNIDNICHKQNGIRVIKEVSYVIGNLDECPYPDYGIFRDRTSSYYFDYPRVVSSRGCPFNCTYCSSAALKESYGKAGPYVRQNSVPYMIGYLESLKREYGPKAFQFLDDVFTLNRDWLLEFMETYKTEIGLPFTCITNPLTVDDESVRALSKGGCGRVYIGLQSGCERIRKRIGRSETNEQVLSLARILKKHGIAFSVNHIFDLPYDTGKEVYDSAVLYSKMGPESIDTASLFYSAKIRIIGDGLKSGILTEEDVREINNGRVVDCRDRQIQWGESHYRRYDLFFNLMPIMPGFIRNRLLKNRRSFEMTNRLLGRFPRVISSVVRTAVFVKNRFFFVEKYFLRDLALLLRIRLKRMFDMN